MGQSTDAILFFGYCWSEEGRQLFTSPDDDDTDEREWQDILAQRSGRANPWDSLPPELNDYARRADADAWVAEHRAEIDAYARAKQLIAEQFTCDIASHCSCDFPMPYVFVKETKLVAARGYPQQVDAAKIIGAPIREWTDQLTTFITALDIDLTEAEGPGWFLVSMWC